MNAATNIVVLFAMTRFLLAAGATIKVLEFIGVPSRVMAPLVFRYILICARHFTRCARAGIMPEFGDHENDASDLK